VNFDGASAVAGLTIDGDYSDLVITGASTYTIDAGSNANAPTSGGGASVVYTYEVNAGAEASAYSLGYGVGGYGLSTFGSPRLQSAKVPAGGEDRAEDWSAPGTGVWQLAR